MGPYPTVVEQPDGGQGLVLQAFHNGVYLGLFNVTFDDAGVVTKYSGSPILLDYTIPEGEPVKLTFTDTKNRHDANFVVTGGTGCRWDGATSNDKVGNMTTLGF